MGDKKINQEPDTVFFLRVQYRCNSSWQGSLQWMDGRKTVVFRSVLELTNLINDAMADQGQGKQERKKTWLDKESVS